jgi:uncharacterized membrane protein
MPFSTAWIANTELAAIPVTLYVSVSVLVNATYLVVCFEAIDRPQSGDVPPRADDYAHAVADHTRNLRHCSTRFPRIPVAGMALICLCLIVFLRPEAPGKKT